MNGSERRAASRAGRFARAFDDKSAGLDRFGLVLALTCLSVIGLALVDISAPDYEPAQDIGALLAAVLVGLTLVTALRASGLSRRRQVTIDIAVLVVVIGYVGSLFGHSTEPGTAGRGLTALLVILSCAAPVVVVLRLVRHREITMSTVMGAVAAYLLIAIAYFYLFLTIGKVQDGYFSTGQPSSTYMYFSLTTITTVGYGDFTAVSRVGRLLANSEAVIGQVYLVTFVAFIVSLGASSWKSRHDAAADAEATTIDDAGSDAG